MLKPYARVSWVHEFEPNRQVTASFINMPAAAFTVDGARAASDAARIDAGAKFAIDSRQFAVRQRQRRMVEPRPELRRDRGIQAGPVELSDDQAKYCPPFADSVEPVISPASSEARNTTQRAISSGSPRRPIGISGRMFFSSTSFGTACTISVLM